VNDITYLVQQENNLDLVRLFISPTRSRIFEYPIRVLNMPETGGWSTLGHLSLLPVGEADW
jgi:hypothetical protein